MPDRYEARLLHGVFNEPHNCIAKWATKLCRQHCASLTFLLWAMVIRTTPANGK